MFAFEQIRVFNIQLFDLPAIKHESACLYDAELNDEAGQMCKANNA